MSTVLFLILVCFIISIMPGILRMALFIALIYFAFRRISRRGIRRRQRMAAEYHCERMGQARQSWKERMHKENAEKRQMHLDCMVKENRKYGRGWHDIEKEMSEYDRNTGKI